MQQFSWCDCISGNQIINGIDKDVYVLIPKEFGGGHIIEHCYDGFGHFGDYDIYELVADWNRQYLEPDFVFPSEITKYGFYQQIRQFNPEYNETFQFKAKEKPWYCPYKDASLSKAGIEFVINQDYKTIGQELTAFDEDNAALPFPIKITYNCDAVYEECSFSMIDPDQGCPTEKYLSEEIEEELEMEMCL